MFHPVLLAEDDRKIANIVKIYLQEAGYRVIHAETGRGAIDAALREQPLLAILDLMLPDTSGEEVCQELREMAEIPIIMLTSKASEEERLAGFALGADDYIVKPFSPRELVYRVKAVLRRHGGEGAAAEGKLSFNGRVLLLDGHSFAVALNGRPVTVTPTEFKILLTLACAPGRAFTRDELVTRALGYQHEGYERSIDAHIKNIRQKIEDDPRRPSFIQTIYGVGYRFNGIRDAA